MSFYKNSPFKDAIQSEPVPAHGSNGGEYGKQEVPDTPSRDGGMYPELHRDTAVTSSGPSTSGPYSTLFKDAVKK
tara:strand:+ start:124 stop:348 length:225 start_codon:yes stop_codon:yes gene_type:complete